VAEEVADTPAAAGVDMAEAVAVEATVAEVAMVRFVNPVSPPDVPC
jgi:hypothetical protein